METCAKSNNKNSDRESGDGKREGSLVLLLLMLLLLLCVLVDEEERLVVARVRVLGLAGEVGGREGPVPVAVADAAVAVVAVGARTRRRHQQLLAPLLALVQKVPQQKEQQIRLAVACQRQKKTTTKKQQQKSTPNLLTQEPALYSRISQTWGSRPQTPPSNYPREGQRTQKLARRPGAVFPKLGVTTPDPILLPAVEVKSHRNSNKGRYCVSQTGVATPYLLPLNYPTWGRTENQTRAGFGISQTWGHDPDLRLAPSTPTPVGSSPTNEEPPLQSRAWNPVFLFNHKCDRDTLIRNETPKKNSK